MRLLTIFLIATFSFIELSGQDTLRILPLGNSITHAENQGSNNFNSYRRQLYFDLATIITAPDTFDFVGTQNTAYDGPMGSGAPFPDNDFDPDHEGHWGIRADEVQASLSSWLSNIDTPDLVLMHLGHNDCFAAQDVAQTIMELEAIIDILRLVNPQVTTFVAQVIPTTNAGFNTCLTELNNAIPAMVTAKNTANSPVILVDQNTGFDASQDTYDGIHPNVTGEMKIADRWFNIIQAFLDGSLPVDLVYFTAGRTDKNIRLAWGTANEIGIDNYFIERSFDLSDFEVVGSVTANNSQLPDEYEFFDYSFLDQEVFYRLRINESDGKIEYSDIVSVPGQGLSNHIHPNVSLPGGTLFLTTDVPQDLHLLDATGKLIKEYNAAANQIQMLTLSAGTYFIRNSAAGWVEKIIISGG